MAWGRPLRVGITHTHTHTHTQTHPRILEFRPMSSSPGSLSLLSLRDSGDEDDSGRSSVISEVGAANVGGGGGGVQVCTADVVVPVGSACLQIHNQRYRVRRARGGTVRSRWPDWVVEAFECSGARKTQLLVRKTAFPLPPHRDFALLLKTLFW